MVFLFFSQFFSFFSRPFLFLFHHFPSCFFHCWITVTTDDVSQYWSLPRNWPSLTNGQSVGHLLRTTGENIAVTWSIGLERNSVADHGHDEGFKDRKCFFFFLSLFLSPIFFLFQKFSAKEKIRQTRSNTYFYEYIFFSLFSYWNSSSLIIWKLWTFFFKGRK